MSRSVVRSIGFVSVTSIAIATMVGQGVFLKGRATLCDTGSATASIAAWAVAGLLVMCGALSFAELATMMPRSGGIYNFLQRSFGEQAAFAFGWTNVFAIAPASIGAAATGAAIFFNRLSGSGLDRFNGSFSIGPLHPSIAGTQLFALGLISLIVVANFAPAKVNGRVAVVLAIAKIGIVAGIAAAGLLLRSHVPAVHEGAIQCVGIAAASGSAGFAAAIIAALFAYNGWAGVAAIAGEIKDPGATFPRAMLTGVLIVIVLYVLANVAFLRTLTEAGIRALPASASIGVSTAEALFGPRVAVVTSAVLFFSTTVVLYMTIFIISRIVYALAADGLLFPGLARLSASGVPKRAVVATAAGAFVLVLVANFDALSAYFVFVGWIFNVATVAGLILLRRREPGAQRPYRVAGYPLVPVAFVTVGLWVLVQTIVTSPFSSGIGLAIAGSSIPAYYLLRRFSRKAEH